MALEKIELNARVLSANEELALTLGRGFSARGIFVVNVLGGAGAGKTSALVAVCEKLRGAGERVRVIEGDIAGSIDTERLAALGIEAVQIETGGTCHLNAAMIQAMAGRFAPGDGGWLFIENIGNLVCPAEYLVGEHLKVVVSSTPEGWDKPYKYPTVFRHSEAVILTKTDLEPFTGFDRARYESGVRALNPAAPIFPLCAPKGEGVDPLVAWLRTRRDETFASSSKPVEK